MGHIYQKVRLRAEKAITVRMLVDTGATFSVIPFRLAPFRLARALGITRPRRSVNVRLANGRRVRLGADVAVLQINGREAPATILVGKVDEPILGVEALKHSVSPPIRGENNFLPPAPTRSASAATADVREAGAVESLIPGAKAV